jgi:predicted DCC family thiol-disulfide oxidoreductase YuxK
MPAFDPRARLLFDSECSLCRACVRRLQALDPTGRIECIPLQDPGTDALLRTGGLEPGTFDSMVFVPAADPVQPGSLRLRTDGIVAALEAIGRRRTAAALRLVPRPIRDAAYRLIARLRR